MFIPHLFVKPTKYRSWLDCTCQQLRILEKYPKNFRNVCGYLQSDASLNFRIIGGLYCRLQPSFLHKRKAEKIVPIELWMQMSTFLDEKVCISLFLFSSSSYTLVK